MMEVNGYKMRPTRGRCLVKKLKNEPGKIHVPGGPKVIEMVGVVIAMGKARPMLKGDVEELEFTVGDTVAYLGGAQVMLNEEPHVLMDFDNVVAVLDQRRIEVARG